MDLARRKIECVIEECVGGRAWNIDVAPLKLITE